MATGMLQRDARPNQYAAGMPNQTVAANPDLGEDQGEQPNVSPELQAQYEKFVTNGLTLIEKASPQLIKRMQVAQNPVEALATATVQVVTRLEDSAAKAGQQLAPEVLIHGGLEIMGTLAEAAEAAGVHTFTEEEIESASFAAMDQYGTLREGMLDKAAIGRDFQAMMEADKAGKLDEVMPGLSEYARKVGGGKGKPAEPAEAE